MNNEEKILEMLSVMQDRQDRTEQILAAMQGTMATMQSEMKDMHEKLDDLIEAHEETRDGVNKLLEWSEKASSALELPLPKII